MKDLERSKGEARASLSTEGVLRHRNNQTPRQIHNYEVNIMTASRWGWEGSTPRVTKKMRQRKYSELWFQGEIGPEKRWLEGME